MYVVLSLLPSTDLDRRVPSRVKSNLLYAVYNHFFRKDNLMMYTMAFKLYDLCTVSYSGRLRSKSIRVSHCHVQIDRRSKMFCNENGNGNDNNSNCNCNGNDNDNDYDN